jgi:hypothetical protein
MFSRFCNLWPTIILNGVDRYAWVAFPQPITTKFFDCDSIQNVGRAGSVIPLELNYFNGKPEQIKAFWDQKGWLPPLEETHQTEHAGRRKFRP